MFESKLKLYAAKREREDNSSTSISSKVADTKKQKLSSTVSEVSSTTDTQISSSTSMKGNIQPNNASPSCVLSGGALASIGRKCGTDKISHHGYHRFYARYLEHYRSSTAGCCMLEIGADRKNSMNMWTEYFPKAFVYGIDINFEDVNKKWEIFKVDQSDINQLMDVRKKISKPCFFIIDDGSHIPEHQKLTFNYFFQELLLPGGTYIIEDIETSYWRRNGLYGYETRYGYRHRFSLIEAFKALVDDVNYEFLNSESRKSQENCLKDSFSHETRRQISSISFGTNCVIIIKKTEEENDLYGNREYRYAKNL